MTIAIRTDASASIGIGHVQRCLALAAALHDLGERVVFVCRDGHAPALAGVARSAHALHLLPAADDRPVSAERDARETVQALGADRPNHVVVDHYSLDAEWHGRVSTAIKAPVAAIDDLADRPLDVDLLIDQNLHDDHRRKYAGKLSSRTQLLGGPRFALLGPAYRAATPIALHPRVDSIGIFLGGTDPGGLSAVALRACREQAGFRGPIEVVSTSANPHLEALRTAVAATPNTSLSLDLADLADFFGRHGIQVGAGGGASWERCCLGVPSLLLQVAANQAAVVPPLVSRGAPATLADGVAATQTSIGGALRALIDDTAGRLRIGERARSLVDGLGAERVACALLRSRLSVVRAEAHDEGRMLAWRNHPVTRSVSHQGELIDAADHARWFTRVRADPARLLMVGHIGTRPVGVIRFDLDARHQAEVSLYLDPALHGIGLGPALLAAGEVAARRWAEPAGFLASVLPSNPASARLFTTAGYSGGGRWHKPAADPDFHPEYPT